MNVSGHVPLSRCTVALQDALIAAGWHDGRVNLPMCLLKLVQHVGCDVHLALRMANQLGPEWAARMLIRQDDPDVPSVDISLLQALLDDYAIADGLGYWRSAGLLQALLEHPALQHHGVALIPQLAALPPARRGLLLNQACIRATENTSLYRFELDDPFYQADYLLTTAREIHTLLEAHHSQHAILMLQVDDNVESWPAQLVSLDDAQLTMRLLAPISPLDGLLNASRLVVDTHINKIKVQFALTEAKVRRYASDVYVDAPMPKTVLRLQRRSHYRLHKANFNALYCQLELNFADMRGQWRRAKVSAEDLSSGGIGFSLPINFGELLPGAQLSDCQLTLANDNRYTVNLRLCNRFREPLGQQWHYGCEFIDPPAALVATLNHEVMRHTAHQR